MDKAQKFIVLQPSIATKCELSFTREGETRIPTAKPNYKHHVIRSQGLCRRQYRVPH